MTFDAIILAAGMSTRMGARNKLLLDIAGEPMISRVVQTYLAAIEGRVTVVTGFEADAVQNALKDQPVTFLHNAEYEAGQQTSVATALAQKSAAEATLLGLGDQPSLEADDLLWLMAEHQKQPEKVTVPHSQTARGNPIVIPNTLRPQMLANPKAPGCRKFTRDNPDLVTLAQTTRQGFFADIDTPEAYIEFSQPAERRPA